MSLNPGNGRRSNGAVLAAYPAGVNGHASDGSAAMNGQFASPHSKLGHYVHSPQPSSANSSSGYGSHAPSSGNSTGVSSGQNGTMSPGSTWSSNMGGGSVFGPPPASMQPTTTATGPYSTAQMASVPGSIPIQAYQTGGAGGYPVSLSSADSSGVTGGYVQYQPGMVSSGNTALPMGHYQFNSNGSGATTMPSYPFGPGGLNGQLPGSGVVLPAHSSQGSMGTFGRNYSSSLGFPNSSNMPSSIGPAAAGQKGASMAAAALAGVQHPQPGAATGAQELSTVAARPQLADDLVCSCPMVCVVGSNRGAPHAVPLDIMSLQFEVNCHISQAFVEMQLVCQYPMNWNDAPLVFFLPKYTDTTITELCIENLVRPAVFATAVVPLDDMKRLGPKAGQSDQAGEPDDANATDPELFMLPLPAGIPGDQYRVKLSYFHSMVFDMQQGKYVLQLPTTIPQVCLSRGTSVNSVLDVAVTFNTGVGGEVDLVCPSHLVSVSDNANGRACLELDSQASMDNVDFIAGYSVWRNHLTATVHVEGPQPGMPDQRGTFALSITPPGPENSVAFPRSVVFMFDRSGSMTGDPIRYAKAALLSGLHMLGPQDQFTVVAFDHEQLWWTDHLIAATPENILQCMHWVNDDLTARGTTDIHAPLQGALKLLSGASGLPFVFLLTDGCVDDEREICRMAESAIIAACSPADPNNVILTMDGTTVTSVNTKAPTPLPHRSAPRIYTFGIGPYCNHYFLKRLATIGRGMSDVAFRPYAIQSVMERMLAGAALPLLSDVQFSAKGLTQVELFPFPIPDVFVGQMLLVSGKFEGDWPEEVELFGTLADGNSWSQAVPTLSAGDLPLNKVFMKNQLDHMTADAWMAGNPPDRVQQIVDLSMASGVASIHTTMIGFETTPEKYQQMQSLPASERRKKITKWAIGGAAGVVVVAGVAAALTFGDLANTMANMPVGDAMTAMGGDLGAVFDGLGASMDCCGGGCECCGACGDMCGACLTC